MAEKGKGLGIAGFVLSLIGIVFLILFPLALVLGILGLIFSIIQLRRNKTGLAIAGLVISIIVIIGAIILLLLTIMAFSFFNSFSQNAYGFAINESNPATCETLNQTTSRDACYATVAAHIKDSSLCEKISSNMQNLKQVCLENSK